MPLSANRSGTIRGRRTTQVVRIATVRNGSNRLVQTDFNLRKKNLSFIRYDHMLGPCLWRVGFRFL